MKRIKYLSFSSILFFTCFLILSSTCTKKDDVKEQAEVKTGIVNASVVSQGIKRDYVMYIPESYTGDSSVPLVLCFHGYTSSANNIMFYSQFNQLADKENFIVVYPQGTLFNGNTHWNVGGWTVGSTVDDVGFTDDLLDSLIKSYNINEMKIYSTGMSNGGYMSFLLACQLNNRIAAIASVSGAMTPSTFTNCDPEHPTPILQIHGDTDKTVPYIGNEQWTKSIDDVLNYWVDFNNCEESIVSNIPDINTSDGSTVILYEYLNGNNNVSVNHYKVIGGGHDWPGARGNMDIQASTKIWDFFSNYDLGGRIP